MKKFSNYLRSSVPRFKFDLKMKLSALLIFCSLCMLQANTSYSQKTKISLDLDNATIERLIDEIESKTEFRFVYMLSDVNMDRLISIKANKEKVTSILKRVFGPRTGGGETSFRVIDRQIYLTKKKKEPAIDQDPVRVTGKVSDENGMPLAGVTVRVAGTNTGVATDFDGNYTITAPSAETVLVFSFLGFATKEITVADQTTIDVTMQEAVNELDEVVLNAGYYNVTERERTGSISKITSKTIEKQPVNNPLAAMQGLVTGVNITETSGLPGTGFNIEIRGKNFIDGGTDPLYIIDGVPYGSESLGFLEVGQEIIPGGGNVSPLNAINPADIESIEVLKDADATAIYGSRGANGVVLITTRKGRPGKTQVRINLSNSLGQVSRFADLLNTQQYLEVRREAFANDNVSNFLENPAFDSFFPDLKVWDNTRDTDWQEELIGGTAYRNNGQLSISGGNEQTSFLFSGSYMNQTTVFPGDFNYSKVSFNTNVNHQSADGRLRFNFSANYVADDNNLPGIDFTRDAMQLLPNAPALFDAEGNLNWENWTSTMKNPLAVLETDYRAQTNNLFANTVISYQLLPSLLLKTNLGFTNYQLEDYRTTPHTSFFNSGRTIDSRFSSIIVNSGSRNSWIAEPQINWQQKLGRAKLDLLAGATFQQQTSEQFAQSASNFPSNSLLLNLSASDVANIAADQDSEYNYQSFFGRINFNWKDTYILNLTGRRDGSSRFGPSRQFGNFWALGTAWLFSEEAFLKDNKLLSFGKLRASYGVTGSDNVPDYEFLDTYSTTGVSYDGVSGLSPTGLFNPDFAWEENIKLEAALELGFFDDRLFLTTAWYRNRSSNQLIGIPLPTTTGFNSIRANFDATVENTGVEVDFRSVNIQTNNFTWSTTFNISVPRNKLLRFDGLEESTFANTLIVGESLSIQQLFHALGVNPETGLYQFEDYNNDGRISFLDDRKWLDDTAPKYFGGLGNTLKYGNLQLDFFFQFKKQQGFNYLRGSSVPGFFNGQNFSTAIMDRWQQPGDLAPIQRFATGFDRAPFDIHPLQVSSNASLTDASFIRLRNVSLAYSLPKTVTKGMDCSISLHGQNLITITNYLGADPEQQSPTALPPLRQFTLRLDLSF